MNEESTPGTAEFVSVQVAPEVDGLSADGHARYRTPYPVVIREDGHVGNQSFWQGHTRHAIGFQKDLAKMRIDLFWADAFKDPEQMVGMYLVTDNADGNWGVHRTAVVSATRMVLDADF